MAARQVASASPVPADVVRIQRALARFAHLITRARQHDRTIIGTGVRVSRAAVPILRLLGEAGPLRPGEIAARLEVEPPHIARQVHLLDRTGYVELVPDPRDGRARQVRLTPAGRDAITRIEQVSREQMTRALAGWTPAEREQLASYLTRMVDDFVVNMASEESAASQARDAAGA